MTTQHPRSRAAFTLIELLVVIAIVAILSAPNASLTRDADATPRRKC